MNALIKYGWLSKNFSAPFFSSTKALSSPHTHATKIAMKKTHWVFTGSQIINGRFMAQVEHSIAATYHDPFAVLDHPLATGADDMLHYANSEVLPPKGTPVTFVIKSKTQDKKRRRQ